MAAQVNNVQPFVSSNAYYGYLPVNPQQQQQQTILNDGVEMDVDNETLMAKVHQGNNNNNDNVLQQKQQTHEFLMSVDEAAHHRRWSSQDRKRGFDRDEVANYMPCFKRFRDGDCIWAEERRLAEVYHDPLLRLSPAADSDMMTYENAMIMGSFKIQPVASTNAMCQELEDMLLLTHGCSSYHHVSQDNDNQEAEF